MSRVWPWIPVALWAVVITSFSTDTFSREHTSRIAVPLLRWLLPHATPDTIELLHVVVRKCAHVFEYFVFGWLLFRAFRGSRQGWTVRWAARAIIFAAVFATIDEIHQLFVPSRGASALDVLLDTAAAAAAIFCLYLWARRGRTAEDGRERALAR
jgi:VanZ family protein